MEHPLTTSVQVLHVDDSEALGDLVRVHLERDESALDCDVTTVTSPTDALDRLENGDFDCVISDYNMPSMNGVEFLERVRERHPELPVLLFSGEEPDDVAAEIIEAGLTDYLRKGYGTEQYTMLVRRVGHAVDSDGQFDAATESQLDGVGVVGNDERFDRADETYAAAYGYDPDEVAGKHWTDLHPDEAVEHIRTHVLPVVRNGGEWRGRSEGLRSDGSTFTESKLVTALDDGRLLIAVSELDDSGLENGD
jgi:PAS domain S-box-containing protein